MNAETESWVTYKMADGSHVWGEYAFVTETEFFDDISEPTEVIRETWRLVSSEVVTFKPATWVDDPCSNCGESLAEHSDVQATTCWAEGGGCPVCSRVGDQSRP